MIEGEKLNQNNNFQIHKLKKARLKRQKKAEYIDFLEQRISQLDRIIKQHNLTFVESSPDSVKKLKTTNNQDFNDFSSSQKAGPFPTPKSVSPSTPNFISYSEDKINIKYNKPSRAYNHDDSINQSKKQKKESSKSENNMFDFENKLLEAHILLQGHVLDVDISLDLTKDYFESAEEFFSIPDEIQCDFYEIGKQKLNFKDDSLNIFHKPNDDISIKKISDSNNDFYDKGDPYGIFSCSFCSFHILYKLLSETESFNDFVYEVIQILFIYCSYFPPDDLIDLEALKKDLNTHNLFLINGLCAYGLALIPHDIPYNIGNTEIFKKKCINSFPAQNLEDFYEKYIKNKQITYKQIFAMSDMFYKEALKYHFFDGPIELHTIEGYISLCLYHYLIGNLYKAWEYLGIAIRYGDAFDLNSYIDNDNFGIEKIISRRLWWKCYSFDTISIKIVNTEGFFNNTRFDKFTPNKIDYNNIPKGYANSEEMNKKKKNSTFVVLYKLVRIWKKAITYSNNIVNKSLNKDYYNSLNFAKPDYSLFKKITPKKDNIVYSQNENDGMEDITLDPQQEFIKLEIKNLWDSIPIIFKRVSLINSSMNPNILKLMASYNLFYYAIIIHLCKPRKILKNFYWSNELTKNSYDRMVCLQSSQRIARFLYYYYKAGIIDLIPNATLFPIFEAVATILSDFRAIQNLLEKRTLKINIEYYEERKKKLIILNTVIIFLYHKAKHHVIANSMLKLISDYSKQYNIPTILHLRN
jgi:hypothetical protein